MSETGCAAPCFTCRTARYTEVRVMPIPPSSKLGGPLIEQERARRYFIHCNGCGANGPTGASIELGGAAWADRQREQNDAMARRER